MHTIWLCSFYAKSPICLLAINLLSLFIQFSVKYFFHSARTLYIYAEYAVCTNKSILYGIGANYAEQYFFNYILNRHTQKKKMHFQLKPNINVTKKNSYINVFEQNKDKL